MIREKKEMLCSAAAGAAIGTAIGCAAGWCKMRRSHSLRRLMRSKARCAQDWLDSLHVFFDAVRR